MHDPKVEVQSERECCHLTSFCVTAATDRAIPISSAEKALCSKKRNSALQAVK